MQRQGPLLSSFLLHLFTGRRERGPRLQLTTLPQLFASGASIKPEAMGQGASFGNSRREA